MIHARAAQLFLLVQKGLAVCQFPHALEGFDAAEHRRPPKTAVLTCSIDFSVPLSPNSFLPIMAIAGEKASTHDIQIARS